MIIREVNEKDLLDIGRVQVESNRSTYSKIMPEDYLSNLSYKSKACEWEKRLFADKNTEIMYVAEDETSKVIGFIAGSLFQTNNIFQREISSIYILKEFQHKGIGKLLFNKLIKKYIEEDISSIILWTLKDNPSRIFYKRLGGKMIDNRFINRGGKELEQIAYVWENIGMYID